MAVLLVLASKFFQEIAYREVRLNNAYLVCAVRLIRSEGGVMTAYDGDLVMVVFIGNSRIPQPYEAALRSKAPWWKLSTLH